MALTFRRPGGRAAGDRDERSGRDRARPGGLAGWASDVLANRVDRRGVLRRGAMAGTALAVAPATYVLRPTSAYAAICAPGALCNDGYTEFCCTIAGANRCPPGTALGGWWKVDGSSFCGGGPRYYLDCNAACNGCGCGANGVCPGACSGTPCGCANGDCNNRKAGCTAFRYGQCNQGVACLGPIVCRVVTCTEPWRLDGTCTTAARTDNRTRFHSRPCAEVDALGNLEDVVVVPGGVRLRGWAYDPSTPTVPLTVNVYDCLRPFASVSASVERPDVAAAFPGAWSQRGFDTFVRLCPGERLVSVAAVDTSGQGSTWIGHRMVTIDGNAFGHLDVADAWPGSLRVAGFAVEPVFGGPMTIEVVVDGAVAATATGDLDRPDVAAAYPHLGGRFGFDVRVATAAGSRNVCVVARRPDGSRLDLGCRTVVVPEVPTGTVTAAVSPGPGALRVQGWATEAGAAGPVSVRVLVDGGEVATTVAALPRETVPSDAPADGFDVTVHGVPAGGHTVSAVAVLADGTEVPLGGADVAVASTVVGQVLALESVPGGVRLVTTAVTRNDGTPASVRVLVDGAFRASLRPGPDGLDEVLSLSAGAHEVQVVATVDGPRTIPVLLAAARIEVVAP